PRLGRALAALRGEAAAEHRDRSRALDVPEVVAPGGEVGGVLLVDDLADALGLLAQALGLALQPFGVHGIRAEEHLRVPGAKARLPVRRAVGADVAEQPGARGHPLAEGVREAGEGFL